MLSANIAVFTSARRLINNYISFLSIKERRLSIPLWWHSSKKIHLAFLIGRYLAQKFENSQWATLHKFTAVQLQQQYGKRSGLMVSALDSGTSGLGSNPDWGHCVVILGKDTLPS